MENKSYEGWAILELMGHVRVAGHVRQEEQFGKALIRIDVPGDDTERSTTQWYGPEALYCLTPTTEEIARAVAAVSRRPPVSAWELSRALPAPDSAATTFREHAEEEAEGSDDEEF